MKSMITLFGRLAGTFNFAKGNKHQQNNNQTQGCSDLSLGYVGIKIHSNFSNSFSASRANLKSTIANIISLVNITKSPCDPGIAATQSIAKLEQNTENTLSWDPVTTKENFINITLAYLQQGENLRRYMPAGEAMPQQ